jgi:hypothetical protein
VNRLVPFAHVVDVRASVEFFGLLGFVPESVLRDGQGCEFWALLRSGGAEIMLARASGLVDAEQQAVLFYMYSTDVAGLRQHLLANGVRDGGSYSGARGPDDGPRTVFEVGYRDYMPAGELRVHDPDGYVILVGQVG